MTVHDKIFQFGTSFSHLEHGGYEADSAPWKQPGVPEQPEVVDEWSSPEILTWNMQIE